MSSPDHDTQENTRTAAERLFRSLRAVQAMLRVPTIWPNQDCVNEVFLIFAISVSDSRSARGNHYQNRAGGKADRHHVSRALVSFNTEKSMSQKRGPIILFRPILPSSPTGGKVNAVGSIQ